jgi:hypothetical protein
MHIIDGNNLAGKLGWLHQPNFDLLLIGALQCFFGNKKNVVIFDSPDYLSDRLSKGSLTVYYIAKDGYYSSADDKVVELALKYRPDKSYWPINVITDDIGIAERLALEISPSALSITKASVFAVKLQNYIEQPVIGPNNFEEAEDDKKLPSRTKQSINDELRKLWCK